MFRESIQLKLTKEYKQLLRDMTIDEDRPGPILRDFEALLSYIGEKGLQITKTYKLRLADVRKINTRFTNPLELGLTRPQQKSYPHVHGLYLLVRCSGLTVVEHVGKKIILRLDESTYQSWQSLNPTERYATLFETWLTRADPAVMGEKPALFSNSGNLYGWMMLLREFSEKESLASDEEQLDRIIRYTVGDYNFGILASFGFVKAEFGPPKPKTSWYLNRLELTRFGNALLTLLIIKLGKNIEHYWYSSQVADEVLDQLQSILQPYFPEWQNNLIVSEPELIFDEGTHIFKVSLGDIWRRIAIPAENDLDSFADAILQAVNFDKDHLYSFTFRDRFGMQVEINHPYMREGDLAHEVEIGDLNLGEGQTMTFLFDFGDNWKFNITLERVDSTMEIDRPVLLEQEGKPPAQYEYWDEDEWEDEDEDEEE